MKIRASFIALLLAACMLSGMVMPRARAQNAKTLYFPENAKINLLTLRGTKATADQTLGNPPEWLLHPRYGEIRFHNAYGPDWWMAELPGIFKVSNLRMTNREPMVSLGYRVKVSTKPLDEAGWATVKPVFEFNGPLKQDGWNGSSGHWQPVPARFVRVEWTGHNGSENGDEGKDHPDLIVSNLYLWGPNKLPITPLVSSAQSTYADGVVLVTPSKGGEGEAPGLNDGDDVDGALKAGYENRVRTNASAADGQPQPNNPPGRVVVTLAHRSMVEAAAYESVAGRNDRPRDMKIYTSPASVGEQWDLQKTLTDISDDFYHEVAFNKPTLAKRVRFDVERVWQSPGDGNGFADADLAEVYVYATALPPDFSYTLAKDAQVTAAIFDENDKLVRSLFQLKTLKAGQHEDEWDGYSDAGEKVPAGDYELRLMTNSGRYENVATLGNTGTPPDSDGHMITGPNAVWVDEKGSVYSANGWDEAGHDWQKWDSTGKSLMNANYQIRNGNPNGLPYQIVTDDKYMYVGYYAHGDKGSEWIERFDRQTGKFAKWAKAWESGLIRIYGPDEVKEWPLTDLAIVGDTLFVGDMHANRVLKYDKNTGEKLGEFTINGVNQIAADAKGRLWISDATSVSIYDADGQKLATPITGLGQIKGLSFSGANKLLLADGKSNQILFYNVANDTASKTSAMGEPAKPGDAQPDHFYKLWDVAANGDGTFVSIQHLPLGGAIMTRWSAQLKPMWNNMGLEFTGNANYPSEMPDSVVSTLFQRYTVDKKNDSWKFNGNLFTGGYATNGQWHGVPRWVKLGANWFFYCGVGDGVQTYKLVGNELRFVAAVGGRSPGSDGEENPQLAQWTWTDKNGDGKAQDTELNWFKKPGEGSYATKGMNVDTRGNVIFCEEQSGTVQILPMLGLNAAGNPTYDWAKPKTVAPKDTTSADFHPIMAVRTDNQHTYAFGSSKLYPPFDGSGPAWMGGWTLAKFDKNGNREWIIRLAQHCTGMDVIPGKTATDPDGGVVCGYFGRAEIFHYTPQGILIGSVLPGKVAANTSGWLDNTASVAANRDPRDGLIDVFAEEDLNHRILWYRIDDSQVSVQKIALVQK